MSGFLLDFPFRWYRKDSAMTSKRLHKLLHVVVCKYCILFLTSNHKVYNETGLSPSLIIAVTSHVCSRLFTSLYSVEKKMKRWNRQMFLHFSSYVSRTFTGLWSCCCFFSTFASCISKWNLAVCRLLRVENIEKEEDQSEEGCTSCSNIIIQPCFRDNRKYDRKPRF